MQEWTKKVQFRPAAPVIKYHQKSSNISFLVSLASDFHLIGDDRDVPALVNSIEESLTLQTEKLRIELIFLMLLWQTELK